MGIKEEVLINISRTPKDLERVTECHLLRHTLRPGDETLSLNQLFLHFRLPAQRQGGWVEGRDFLRWLELSNELLFANAVVAEEIVKEMPHRILCNRNRFPSKDPTLTPEETTICFPGTLWRCRANNQLVMRCLRGTAGMNPPWQLSHRWVLGEKFGPHDYFARLIPDGMDMLSDY